MRCIALDKHGIRCNRRAHRLFEFMDTGDKEGQPIWVAAPLCKRCGWGMTFYNESKMRRDKAKRDKWKRVNSRQAQTKG